MSRSRIVEELRRIERKKGVLRPEDVVEFARNPKTALHEQFTWDDTEAAQRYRIWQARQVIRVSVVMLGEREEPVKAFVSLMDDRKAAGGGYRSTVTVMRDDELRSRLLAQAKHEAREWGKRYRMFEELVDVVAAIDALEGAAVR